MGELIAALVALLVPASPPCDVLTALDVVRAAAWSAGDERVLAQVYGPSAGDRDVAALASWRERGIRVDGMRTARSRCRPTDAHTVDVVERLTGAVAVLPDGSRRALPQDGWSRRRITLDRVDGRWRIVAVG